MLYGSVCVPLVRSCSCTTPAKGSNAVERINPVEEFGAQLEAAGFAKYGQVGVSRLGCGKTGCMYACPYLKKGTCWPKLVSGKLQMGPLQQYAVVID